MKMKQYRYVKSNAFTAGGSLGNPAACIFTEQEQLTPEQMQAIAAEHKGFVMEVVFCSQSDVADCKLTYYSSECEVEFCGHGTIATMYTMVKEIPKLLAKPVITVETNCKGIIEVYNAINEEDAVYITAPDQIEYPMNLSIAQIEGALSLPHDSVRKDLPIRIIDAGLRTLIVPICDMETEISVYPNEQSLKDFCLSSDIDIILIFSKQTLDSEAYAHTRVFAPKFGYLEDPATGSGNSAFANYLLSEMLWDGHILFGGKATKKIEGLYFQK